MTMNKPTLQEKENAISHILSEGLQEPEGIGAFFMRLYRSLGLKYIFYESSQVISLSMIVVLGLVIFVSANIDEYTYTTIFLLSPLSFVLVVTLTEWIERNHPIYELKSTFKYTMKDLIIFRTLIYSFISIVISVVLSVSITATLDILRAISISFSALFLCALLTVAINRRYNHKWPYLTSFGVWSAMNLVPLLLVGSQWESFLSNIPLGLTLIASIGLIYLYVYELRQLINMKEGEVRYNVTG